MIGQRIKMSFLLLAGMFLVSCQKGDVQEVADEISVSVSEIQASASLASYSMEVSSNTRWNVSIEAEDVQEVIWATLSRTSGSGNLQVSVRVTENRFNEERKAKIVFVTKGGKKAETVLVQAADKEGGETPADDLLCVGSYNLRMSHLDNGTDNAWSERKERLKTSMLSCPFDFFGIQEVDDKTQTWLDSELSSKYSFCYFSPYSQNGKGSRAQGIGYRKDKFTLSDWHYFWACSTPDVMTVNDKGSQGSFNRGGCCCILTHKATGARFFVMNNHGCLNAKSNEESAPVYVEMEKKYNKEGLPSFFVGDMNAKQSSVEGSVYMTYAAHWTDSYLKAVKRTGAAGTYNGYKSVNGSSRIDYVFYRGEGLKPQLYHCDNTLYGGFYPSDHFPLWVKFKIEK